MYIYNQRNSIGAKCKDALGSLITSMRNSMGKNSKFLLLNLPNPPGCSVYRGYAGGFGTAGNAHGDVLFPVYLLYGISAIKKSGCMYSVLDAQAMNYSCTRVINEVKKIAPDVLISWISLPSIYEDLKLIDAIKKASPDTIIAGLGTICNVMPEEVLFNSNADIAVEGRYPHYNLISNLVNLLNNNQNTPDVFNNIPGARYKINGQIVHSPLKPCDENLDQLSLDAYYELPVKRYLGGITDINGSRVECLPVVTGTGCPFSCMYCPYPIGYGKKVIQKSVDNIITEISFLKNNFGIKGFVFRDQLFTYDKERIIRLCDEIVKNDLDVKWLVEARADQVDKELIMKMKEAGCFRVHYGVETGDPEMLANVGKPRLNVEIIKNAFRMTREAGIYTLAHMIIGLPGENQNTLKNSLNLLCHLCADEINLNIATPYPGTLLFEVADKKGWISTRDWSKYTSFEAVMKTDELDIDTLVNARKNIKSKFQNFKLMHDAAYTKLFLKKLSNRAYSHLISKS